MRSIRPTIHGTAEPRQCWVNPIQETGKLSVNGCGVVTSVQYGVALQLLALSEGHQQVWQQTPTITEEEIRQKKKDKQQEPDKPKIYERKNVRLKKDGMTPVSAIVWAPPSWR